MLKYFRAPPKAIARPRDPAFNSINVDNNDYEDRFQVSYQKQEDQQGQQQGEYLRSRRQLRQCHRLATVRCRAGWSCWFCVLYLRLLCFCVCFQAEQVCLAVFVFLFACVYLCCAGLRRSPRKSSSSTSTHCSRCVGLQHQHQHHHHQH